MMQVLVWQDMGWHAVTVLTWIYLLLLGYFTGKSDTIVVNADVYNNTEFINLPFTFGGITDHPDQRFNE